MALCDVSEISVCAREAVPWLCVAQMRAIDDVAMRELGIELKQMMENAGRNLAVLTRAHLGGAAEGRRVTVLAGPAETVAAGSRRLAISSSPVRRYRCASLSHATA